MSSIEKLIIKIKNNPRSVSFNDLKKIIERNGWKVINIVGSHYTFEKDNELKQLVKPHGKRKELYEMEVKTWIKKLKI